MKTVIFILALTALAAPVFSAEWAAIACPANRQAGQANCNMCLEDTTANTVKTTGCFDCQAGYYLTTARACTQCTAGMGRAAGTATAGTAGSATAPTADQTCSACHASCVTCLGVAAGNCLSCNHGMWANAFTAGTGATCVLCTKGKGRAAAAAASAVALTQVETEATVCSVTCATGAANCKGTNAADALYCAANYWLSTNTCTACDMGKAKAASTAVPTTAETAASCAICAKDTYYTATGCTACPAGKTRTAPTEAPKAVEADTVCTAAAGSGSSATLIQALCGASVAAYALF